MSTLGSFVWSIADQLRGPYRPNQYGTVNAAGRGLSVHLWGNGSADERTGGATDD